MARLKIVLALFAVGLGLAAQPAYAHGFGDRYDLPVPLGYFMAGAGAAVAFSFVVIGLFMRRDAGQRSYWRYNLLGTPWLGTIVASPFLSLGLKLISVFLLGLVIATGLAGNQNSPLNFAPTFVWIIWWVGMGFAVALVGNLWALINPWKALFEWAEWLYTRFRPGGSLSLKEEYPESLAMWPALVSFFLFAWLENAYPESSLPSRIGVMGLVYTAITLAGMAYYGKHQWLRSGEAFSVVFSFLARFAPTEVRTRGPDLCRRCEGDCLEDDGECVNCYECFEMASKYQGAGVVSTATPDSPETEPNQNVEREFNLRPYALGLASNRRVTTDILAMVVLLLSTVTFDGLSATPAWLDVQDYSLDIFAERLDRVVINGITIVDTLGLALFPVAFLLVYLSFSYLMSRSVGGHQGAGEMARTFVYSLIPIALAYNIAHFLTLLIIQGQLIIPLASDPFGRGWDLFGTADYSINIGIISARGLWFLSVAVIVVGHVIAVYLAHKTAMRLFKDPAVALRSQFPMLALMVLYTAVSLWIIAQPIVD